MTWKLLWLLPPPPIQGRPTSEPLSGSCNPHKGLFSVQVPWLEWSVWDALPAPPQLPPTRATSLGPGDISAPSICKCS